MEFEFWVKESLRNGVTVVVIGDTGIGKSTLVNGLIGGEAIKKAATGLGAKSVTHNVEAYPFTRGCVDVEVFDTPGLTDADKNPFETFKDIATKTKGKIDLLIYCHDMTSRVTSDDLRAINNLAVLLRQSTAQGDSGSPSSAWETVLYVLTYANRMPSLLEENLEGSQTVEQMYEEYLKEQQDELRVRTVQALQNQGVPHPDAKKVADEIPIIPAGFKRAGIVGCPDWLSALWRSALSRVNASAAPAFIDATACHRLQEKGAGPDQRVVLPKDRNIDNTELSKMMKMIDTAASPGPLRVMLIVGLCATAGGIVGAVAGPAGIGIGSALGASAVAGMTGTATLGTVAAGGAAATGAVGGAGTLAGILLAKFYKWSVSKPASHPKSE